MSDGRAVPRRDVARVLIVGDSGRVDAATAALEDRFDAGAVVTVPDVGTARDRLARDALECVVVDVQAGRSERDDGEANASAVASVRDANPDVPVVALVEAGDGTGASDAIAAGATDVVRSDDAAAVVASRVANAIERFRLASTTSADGRYRALLEGSDALVVLLDDDGDVDYVSPAVERATGHTPDEIERRNPSTFVHPDDRDRLADAFADLVEASHGSTVGETVRIRHADGTWHVYATTLANRLADPLVEGVVATIEAPGPGDRRETDLETALDRLSEAFLSLGPDWEITHANASARELFRLEEAGENLAGTVVWDLLPEAVREPLFERCLEARRTNAPVTFELVDGEGSNRLEVTIRPSGAGEGSSSGSDDDRPSGSDGGVTVLAREREADDGADELRTRLDRYEGVLESLAEGVVVLEESRVVYANRRAAALVGRDALVGLSLADVFPDELAAGVRDRAHSPIVRRSDPLEATLEGDDGSTPVTVSVASPGGVDATVCVLRDASTTRAAERALALLGGVGRDLRSIDTRYDVYRSIVRAAEAALEADFVGFFLSNEDGFRPVAVAGRDDVSADAVGSIRWDDAAAAASHDAGSATVHRGEAVERLFAPAGIRGDRAVTVPVGDEGLLLATATGPGRVDAVERAFVEALAAAASVGLESVDRDATIRERERDLEDAEARAERYESVLERIASIERCIAGADDREAIERCAVEELVGFEDVSFAWVGEAAVAAGAIEPRIGAGDYRTYVDHVTLGADPDEGEPTGRTVATGTPTFVADVLETAPGPEWRREALDAGVRSIYSVPLLHDDYRYGALSIYAERPAAFDDAARTALSALGESMAHAIGAVETRRALLSDQVTELELSMRDDDGPFSVLAAAANGRLDVESIVPRSDGLATAFVAVPADAADAVERAADPLEAVVSVRSIAGGDDAVRFELTVDASTPIASLAEHGAAVRSISRREDRTVLTVQLPRDADVRSFVEMLNRKRPGVELVTRRKRDRSRRSPATFRDAFRERLSTQQRRTLETAYHSGFFEWPRERTGEEVAESLGVSQPTFNRHYRAAERKLFTLLFEE